MPAFSGNIPAGDSDAYQNVSTGNVDATAISMTLASTHAMGVRFQLTGVPKGATISNAKIQFTAVGTNGSQNDASIACEAVDNGTGWTSGVNSGVTSKVKTSATVTWIIPSFTFGERAAPELTPDISAPIQEVINRDGWVAGNHLVVIFTNTAGTAQRLFATLEHTTLEEATLTFDWTSGYTQTAFRLYNDDGTGLGPPP